jgi:tetratricopeptide (TPR) repeat protein
MTAGSRQQPVSRPKTKGSLGRYSLCLGTLLLIFSVLGVSAEPTITEGPQALFDRAAEFYGAGQYEKAITEYDLLLEQGFESGPLYYNLGNCFLKKWGLGKAILNYERAGRLIPADSDLKSNYQYAKSLLRNDQQRPRGEEFPDQWLAWFSIDGLTSFLTTLYLLSVLILISGLLFPAIKRFSRSALLLLAIVFLFCGLGLNRKISLLDREAVILAPKVEAKFQPFDRAPTSFSLEEGNKVQILRSSHGWVKVRHPDKKVGWVKTFSLEVI